MMASHLQLHSDTTDMLEAASADDAANNIY